jgi:hypothetical protein
MQTDLESPVIRVGLSLTLNQRVTIALYREDSPVLH